jgi:PAS domain S-box-containing protein
LKGSSELAKEKYEINSQTVIIVTSGDIAKLGIILSVNSLVEDLYGMKDKDLVGHNVIKLVPDVLKDDHQEYLKDFFEREEEERPLLTTERIVYAKNSKNYLVPSSIMLKSMPEVTGYAKIVAFLTPLANLHKQDNDAAVAGLLVQNEQGGILHGVTEQCEKMYGIMRSKIFGKKNDEFRLDKIFPELFKEGTYPFEDGKEITTKLDTTSLKKVGDDESEEESIDLEADNLIDVLDKVDHNDEEDSKDLIFRIYDVKLKVKRFVQKKELWYLTIISDKVENEAPELSEYMQENDNKEESKEETKEIQFQGKNDNSEQKRKLQEFYTSIKEKNFPKKIKSMIRLYVLSILAILAMAVVAFYFNFSVKSSSDEAMTVFGLVAQRSLLIPQIIFNCQTIKILVDGLYSSLPNQTAIEKQARDSISTLVNQLQHVNVDAVNYQIQMDSSKGSDSKNKRYQVVLLLSNNQTSTFSKDFNDALLQFVTSASLIQNETLDTWKLDLINSPLRDYYFVEQNGLKVLRAANDDVTSLFSDYYAGQVSSFSTWLYVQLCLLVFILMLAITASLWTHVRLLAIYKLVAVFLGHLTAADLKAMRANADAFEQS